MKWLAILSYYEGDMREIGRGIADGQAILCDAQCALDGFDKSTQIDRDGSTNNMGDSRHHGGIAVSMGYILHDEKPTDKTDPADDGNKGHDGADYSIGVNSSIWQAGCIS